MARFVLDFFESYLLARKDVEAKAITLEAQKAIMNLESVDTYIDELYAKNEKRV